VLGGLAVAVAATALIAGITGAFSPCGFSMVDTIGGALGDTRRSSTLLACATFTLGSLLGGVATFGGLALVGRLLGDRSSGLAGALGAAVAVAAALADWRGVRIAPQIRRQVPERWRWQLPLPLACGLYGLLLGLGFTTFVLSFAVWALAGISVAAGSVALGVLVGVAFGVGRALPVVWLAPGVRDGAGERRLDELAGEPRLWLGMRRLDALGLVLCALFIGGPAAKAATLSAATDPSAAGGALAWQRLGGSGALRLASGEVRSLPGGSPALGGSSLAWSGGGRIAVVDLASMTPKLTLAVAARVSALAVSDGWLAYRLEGAGGEESLVAVSLADPSQRQVVASARQAGEIGRPALEGATLAFAFDTPRHSRIEALSLTGGARRTLRFSGRYAVLANPSLLDGRLLYERVDRCAQQLRLGATEGLGRKDRVLLSLPSTVRRDHGYQPGYEHAYNSASRCRNRRSGRGGSVRLGATALAAGVAYVSETRAGRGRTRILGVAR
jgi:hypothetical protein